MPEKKIKSLLECSRGGVLGGRARQGSFSVDVARQRSLLLSGWSESIRDWGRR